MKQNKKIIMTYINKVIQFYLNTTDVFSIMIPRQNHIYL